MAGEVANAWVSITPTFDGGLKKISKELGGVGGPAGKSAGRGFLGGFGGVLTAAAGSLAVGSFFTGAISAASELQQSTGAIDAVFKDSASQMHEWAKSAATDVGLTRDEYNKLGTVIGAQLKNGGVAMDQLAPKTQNLLGMGADMASMFGGTTKEAVEAMSAALRGERDPIERYGVSLNQAAVEAKAAELGFAKVGGSLSLEASQAATLAIIMEQTADAHGNFAKEQATFAGQQQRAAAQWGNISAAIGGLFLPALTSVVGYLNTSILPAVASFVDGLGQGGLMGVFGPLAAVVAPFFETLSTSFGPLIPQVLALAAAFSPLGLIFQIIQPLLPQITGLFSQLAVLISGVLAAVLPLVTTLVTMLTPILVGLATVALPLVVGAVRGLIAGLTAIAPAAGIIAAVIGALLIPMFIRMGVQAMLSAAKSVAAWTMKRLAAIKTGIAYVVQSYRIVASWVRMAAAAIVSGAQTAYVWALYRLDAIKSAGAFIAQKARIVGAWIAMSAAAVVSGAKTAAVWTGTVIASAVRSAASFALQVGRIVAGWVLMGAQALIHGARMAAGWVLAMGPVGWVIAAVIGLVALIIANWEKVSSFTRSLWGNVTGFLSDAWSGMVSTASNFIGDLLGFFRDLPGEILGFLTSLPGKLLGIGKDMIQGLINGISDMGGAIIDAIGGVVGGAIDFAKDMLGIHSPSRVFMEIGEYTGEGMAVGLESQGKAVQRAADSMVPTVDPGEYVRTPRMRFDSLVPEPGAGAGGLGPGAGARQLVVRGPLVEVAELTVDSDDRVKEVAQDLYTRASRADRAQGGVKIGGMVE